ncbi:MAG: hypothetical protein AAGJ29_02375 [Pseudomonadota bacterium]
MTATPSSAQDSNLIIGFALQLTETGGETAARDLATSRGWLNAEGVPTASGQELIQSLTDQRGTRTVFRPF